MIWEVFLDSKDTTLNHGAEKSCTRILNSRDLSPTNISPQNDLIVQNLILSFSRLSFFPDSSWPAAVLLNLFLAIKPFLSHYSLYGNPVWKAEIRWLLWIWVGDACGNPQPCPAPPIAQLLNPGLCSPDNPGVTRLPRDNL